MNDAIPPGPTPSNPEGITPTPPASQALEAITSAPAAAASPTRRRRRFGAVGVFLSVVILTGLGVAGVWWYTHVPPHKYASKEEEEKEKKLVDMEPVLRLNNRGVGLMEQHDFKDAIKVFEEVTIKAPNWQPGRINLGIALMNAKLGERAKAVFEAHLQSGNDQDPVLEEGDDIPVVRRSREAAQYDRYAHFCLGIILFDQSKMDEAAPHFLTITGSDKARGSDPADPAAWYFLGMCLRDKDAKQSIACYRKALELDPHMTSAISGLVDQLRGKDEKEFDLFFKQEQAFRNKLIQWEYLAYVKYTEMGKYANVIPAAAYPRSRVPSRNDINAYLTIRLQNQPLVAAADTSYFPASSPVGPLPAFLPSASFKVKLADGARWATTADFGKGAVAQLRAAVRKRFGGTIVVLDYNRDGKPDLFVVGAVVEKGQVRDLLLRNKGEGLFVDVTAEAGLATPHPTLGCCAADFDNDGYPDLLLTGAGSQRLFRNNRKGGFEDVTRQPSRSLLKACATLALPNQPLGIATCTSYFLTAPRNVGLHELQSVCLTGAFVDLDQDGDLDLVVAEFAATPEEALKALKGEKKTKGGGLRVYINKGLAPPQRFPKDNQLPLACCFERATDLKAPDLKALHGAPRPVAGLAVADLDGDRDPDLFVLPESAPPDIVINDRLLRFRRQDIKSNDEDQPDPIPGLPWNGALVLDVAHAGRSDVLLVPWQDRPHVLYNRATPRNRKDVTEWFRIQDTGAPPLRQAVAVDLDLDSWTDVVGLSTSAEPPGVPHLVVQALGAQALAPLAGPAAPVAQMLIAAHDMGDSELTRARPVLLHNQQGRLTYRKQDFGPPGHWPADLIGLTVFPSGVPTERGKDQPKCGGIPDVLVWSESRGLQLYANQGNGNHAVQVQLVGQIKVDGAGLSDRSNADGIGTVVAVQAGNLWAGQENTTLAAGLGQSRQPVLLGLRRFPRAGLIRLRWPDGVVQAELDPACGLLHVTEKNRKGTSCPVLFTWDGKRFTFVTDFLGAGSMGELGPDRTTRPPRPEESVKIEAGQLVPRDGQYVLELAEPMDEITYLDRLQLVAIDHPADAHVYPDERFAASGPPPSQKLIAFRERVFPVKARDHRGRDVTRTLRKWDRDTADGFAKRAWIGFAEEHFVELDFGDRLAAYRPGERLFLCLAGWTDYAYPQSIWAAHQAGVEMLPPVLERQGDDGRWHTVAEAGFPAGLPRMMLLDVTGKLTGPRCRLRLRTNLHVYWDQIFVAGRCRTVPADGKPAGGVRATCLEVDTASLGSCGIHREYSPDGKLPTIFDHDRYENVLLTRLAGRMTRHGDVTELLRARDDRFVLFGPGDKVTVRFDARRLPPLPPGWKRSFVLRTWGYCKDTSLFTATGETVEPLPFAGMRSYPYGPDQHYPRDPLHAEYRKRYNTREVKAEGFAPR